MLIVVFSSSNSLTQSKIEIIDLPKLSSGVDFTAPLIFLNISAYNATGLLTGKIIETDSNIDWYSLMLNSTELNTTVVTNTNAHLVEFSIDANLHFNTAPGLHNYLNITAYNDASDTIPAFKQGGGSGGSGGFMFCDDPNCWGPMPLHPDSSPIDPPSFSGTDKSAPAVNISLVSFPCCGSITYDPAVDPESGVAVADVYTNVTDTITFYSKNNDNVSIIVTLTWAALEKITTPTEEGPYMFLSGIIFVVFYLVYKRRKKLYSKKK